MAMTHLIDSWMWFRQPPMCRQQGKERTMKGSYIPQGALTLGLIVGLNTQGWAQQPASQQYDIGKLEYQASCASCHGIDGKGTGPVAPSLNKKPADLTMLAKQNNGVFPFGRIYDTIDGRVEVKSHGTREMPIFGFRFSPPPTPGFSPIVPYFVDPLYDREPVVRTRILAVIDYLYRIQEK
jgi:mono/diheme cytochrome c family protein